MAGLVPVVLACSGELRAFPIHEERQALLERLTPSSIFCFETALELRHGRRLLTGQDLHVYTLEAPAAGALVPTPPLLPIHSRPPQLFQIQVDTLPTAMDVNGRRVVSAELLVREYLGALGHRFDLLATLLHLLKDDS